MPLVDVEVRDAVPGEKETLEALQLQASLVWEEYRADLEAHPEEIAVEQRWIAAGWVRVAVTDEGAGPAVPAPGGGGVVVRAIVGFSVVLPRHGKAVELDGLFVDPRVQGRGVGRRLVDDAADRARSRGAQRVDVIANPNALGFYERVGFVVVAEVPTKFGPAVRMTLPLA